jgi:hypothetical protein
MSNFTKLDFETLDILIKNYLAWALDAEIHFEQINSSREGESHDIPSSPSP